MSTMPEGRDRARRAAPARKTWSQSLSGAVRVQVLAVLLMASCWPGGGAAGSDVIMPCPDCPVGVSERQALARLLRASDVVFEGTCLGGDSIRSGYERGSPLMRFRVSRLLRGLAPAGELEMMAMRGVAAPGPDTPLLVWALRGCTIDAHPCGNFLSLTPQRTMLWNTVDSDWRVHKSLLSVDSLEWDVAQLPDSTGLEAFGDVDAIGLAQLEISDPVNPPRPGREPTGSPDNGGTWPLEGIRWVVGRSDRVPHFVRFPRRPWRPFGSGARFDDRFLLPIRSGDAGDTLVVKTAWRPMLVRRGEAVGFGVPADSLATLYHREDTGYHLKVPQAP